MTKAAKERMWEIDHQSQFGNDISREDKLFFNANYEIMLKELEESFIHFKHHADKFKYDL